MERMRPPLHNFDLPVLKWGNQRLLRCMKVEDMYGDVSVGNRKRASESYGGGGGDGGGYVTGTRRRESKVNKRFRSNDYNFPSSEKLNPVAGVTGDDEIEATREKLMFDFQTEVDKMKDAILRERLSVPTPASVEKPWNLRTRRAACKAPLSPSNGVKVNGDGEALKPNFTFSPVNNEFKYPKFRQANGVGAVESTSGEKKERPKFSVFLSRSEMEDDFMAMTGRRLPRKPKKRLRAVQRLVDTVQPGLWLREPTPDLYKVLDEAETGKR
uniref:uncharacterized protein LOC122584849 n=1 Tax=Erigeron canadensis TaxID=72917 RepID=UPI001CB93CA8|nr:uncharacterized protein LOC122584849 [Erigeron canadensis]